MKGNRIHRASLLARLHFLFTGEIPGYWTQAQYDVLSVFIEKTRSEITDDEKKDALEFRLSCYYTSRINPHQAKSFIPRHHRDTSYINVSGAGQDYIDYFPKNW